MQENQQHKRCVLRYLPGEILKDLVSNLFPGRKAASQEDNPVLKKFFAFEGISFPIHGAIENFTFLPVKSNAS